MSPTDKHKPSEGLARRMLPMLPEMAVMTRIPLGASNAATSVETSSTVDAGFEKVAEIIAKYNQHLCFVDQSDNSERQEMSESLMAIVREINRIGAQAERDVKAQVDSLGRAVENFAWKVREAELDLSNPAWSTLDTVDFEDRVQEIEGQGPAQLVQSVLSSFREAVALSSLEIRRVDKSRRSLERFRNFWTKLCAILRKLLTFDGGENHAFELCFQIRIHRLLGPGDVPTSNLDRVLMSLLSGLPAVPDAPARPVPNVDFPAMSRRLRRSMQKYGCAPENTIVRGSRIYKDRCACYRADSLRLLHELQTRAHCQVRSKVMLTIGAIVPGELCDAILEFAFMAEDIPADSRVSMPEERMGGTRKEGRFQNWIHPDYRCLEVEVLWQEDKTRVFE